MPSALLFMILQIYIMILLGKYHIISIWQFSFRLFQSKRGPGLHPIYTPSLTYSPTLSIAVLIPTLRYFVHLSLLLNSEFMSFPSITMCTVKFNKRSHSLINSAVLSFSSSSFSAYMRITSYIFMNPILSLLMLLL